MRSAVAVRILCCAPTSSALRRALASQISMLDIETMLHHCHDSNVMLSSAQVGGKTKTFKLARYSFYAMLTRASATSPDQLCQHSGAFLGLLAQPSTCSHECACLVRTSGICSHVSSRENVIFGIISVHNAESYYQAVHKNWSHSVRRNKTGKAVVLSAPFG